MMPTPRAGTVAILGTAQTLAWASTYYLPAILAAPMARDLGVSVPTVFAAFSVALMVSALVGPRSGAVIDRVGGRPVLMATSIVFAIGLIALGLSQGLVGLFAGWIVIGVGMGSGLYESAFASLVRLHGAHAQRSITGITLIAGFASTVGWPLSAYLESRFGWQYACFAWAALHIVVGLPLNALVPKPVTAFPPDVDRHVSASKPSSPDDRASLRPTLILSFVFAATWFISTAMAAHLPRLMQAAGASASTAVFVGSLIGPAQVAARVLDFGWLSKLHPLLSARVASAMHPLGALALLAGGPEFAPLFGILHGAGNGILTIAKGTLPLVLFGPGGYGRRQGILAVPARAAQALAPWAFGLALDQLGAGALALSAAIGGAALIALAFLPQVAVGRASSLREPI